MLSGMVGKELSGFKNVFLTEFAWDGEEFG